MSCLATAAAIGQTVRLANHRNDKTVPDVRQYWEPD